MSFETIENSKYAVGVQGEKKRITIVAKDKEVGETVIIEVSQAVARQIAVALIEAAKDE